MISVAMCTYNGEHFILKQLESIYNQSLPVDEVIICDDKSTDNTIHLINQFIYDNKINNCKLYINEKNIGFVKNFWQCISKTSGDIIFLSDQDDIWHYDKVKIMSKVLNENDNIKCLFAELSYIDENDLIINYNHDHSLGILYKLFNHNRKLSKLSYKRFIKTGGFQGASVAFKKEIYDAIKYFDIENRFAHDVFINFYASILNGFYIINKKLMHYRIHSTNTLGVPIYKKRNRLLVLSESVEICNQIVEFIDFLSESKTILNNEVCTASKQYVLNLINIYKQRIINIKNRRLIKQLFLLLKINYFPNIKTYLGDIYNIIFGLKV